MPYVLCFMFYVLCFMFYVLCFIVYNNDIYSLYINILNMDIQINTFKTYKTIQNDFDYETAIFENDIFLYNIQGIYQLYLKPNIIITREPIYPGHSCYYYIYRFYKIYTEKPVFVSEYKADGDAQIYVDKNVIKIYCSSYLRLFSMSGDLIQDLKLPYRCPSDGFTYGSLIEADLPTFVPNHNTSSKTNTQIDWDGNITTVDLSHPYKFSKGIDIHEYELVLYEIKNHSIVTSNSNIETIIYDNIILLVFNLLKDNTTILKCPRINMVIFDKIE